MLKIELLEELLKIPSPTGYTQRKIEFLDKYIKTLGYTTSKNQKGNLIVEVKGKDDYNLGLFAHIDTLGLMVRSIKPNGKLAFTTLGGPILPTYDGEYCTIHTRDNKEYSGTVLSTSPSVHVYKDARTKERSEETMEIRIDELVYSKKDVENLGIQNGDIISINPKFEYTTSKYIKTRFLDDQGGAFLLLEVLRSIKEENIIPNHNLKIVFSTYEETGHGAANIPEINEILAVDMGCIGLDLQCNEEMVSICAKDAGGPYDYDMTTKLINIAKEEKLLYAVDVYPFYSSDATAALKAGNDVKCALIGPGIHASHGMERTHYNALENTYKLIMKYILK
jgi:putative aminopeptidase FrvX